MLCVHRPRGPKKKIKMRSPENKHLCLEGKVSWAGWLSLSTTGPRMWLKYGDGRGWWKRVVKCCHGGRGYLFEVLTEWLVGCLVPPDICLCQTWASWSQKELRFWEPNCRDKGHQKKKGCSGNTLHISFRLAFIIIVAGDRENYLHIRDEEREFQQA